MPPPPFQRFLESHGAEVLRFLTASVGRDEADDCFQETFVAALRAYPRLRDGGNLRAWILTIAHRKAIDAHRGRARRPLPVDPAGALADTGAAQPAPVAGGDPDLWEAVRALPEKQRGAVVLRHACDLEYAEVALVLRCSEPAARRSVHEGLSKLKEALS